MEFAPEKVWKHKTQNVSMQILKIEIDENFDVWFEILISNHTSEQGSEYLMSPKAFKAHLVNYEE